MKEWEVKKTTTNPHYSAPAGVKARFYSAESKSLERNLKHSLLCQTNFIVHQMRTEVILNADETKLGRVISFSQLEYTSHLNKSI